MRNHSDSAHSELSDTLYHELRMIAQRQLTDERRNHTLQATALVHEAYMRLQQGGAIRADMGAVFYWAAAEAMRRVLIDHARSRNAIKRGGEAVHKPWSNTIADVCDLNTYASYEEIELFNDAVLRLCEHDSRAGDIVRLRFYAGLSVAQTAEVMEITERIVKRDWEYARVWLLRELKRKSEGQSDGKH